MPLLCRSACRVRGVQPSLDPACPAGSLYYLAITPKVLRHAPHRLRCPIKPTELGALLSAAQGVSEALEQSSARHGNAYTFQQLTRLNFPADDVGMAQVLCPTHKHTLPGQ